MFFRKIPSVSYLALPLLTSFLFAGSFVAGKITTVDLLPLTTACLRYLFTVIFFFILGHIRDRTQFQIHLSHLGALFFCGLLGVVGYHFFFFSALSYTAPVNTAIINATSPIITGALAAIFIQERLRLLNYGGILLAVLGVIALLSQGQLENVMKLNLGKGEILMLCGVVCWAIYTLIVKRLAKHLSSFTITFYSACFGVLQLLFLAALENPMAQIKAMGGASILAIAYMGIAASGMGYLLYNQSIAALGPTRTSSLIYSLVPIFVAILGLLFFRQPITPIMVLSMGLILGGLQLMLRQRSVGE